MLASCEFLTYPGGCDPKALVDAIEKAGIEVVESVSSMTNQTVVLVRRADMTDEVRAAIDKVVGKHKSKVHPVSGAICTNPRMFLRRFPGLPVEE